MTALQQNLLLLAIGWLTSQVSVGDIKRFLMFGPGKWRLFRIARVQDQLKWDRRVHGSAYELCLFMFWELLMMLFYGLIMYGLAATLPPKSANAAYSFILICLLSRVYRLLKMMSRLTHYDQEIPKVEEKLKRLMKGKTALEPQQQPLA